MKEIISINLENEMDLILAHKRSMKLGELCGLSVLTQTSFATAVSEISRCMIGNKYNKSVLTLSIKNAAANKKELNASISTLDTLGKEHDIAIKYATRLIDSVKVTSQKNITEVTLTQKINFSGLINDVKIESFITYFKKEHPLSPYDELRKKNIQLLELSEKLSDRENQYKVLTETVPLMMFTANASGFINYINKWLKDYFNLLDMIPGKLNWQSLLHDTDNKTVREEWKKAQSGQLHFKTQVKLKAKNNEEPLWHLASILPLINDHNQVVSWTGFFVDIHAQKVVENTLKNNIELKTAQKQLLNYQNKLEEKVTELNKSNHDLEQFAYIASHDLQEPLRKIRSFTELLEKNFDDKEKAKKYLGKIDSSSERMSSLIKGVLNYSRLSTAETIFEQTDLQKIVEQVKQDIELVIEEKKASVTAGSLPVISAIPQQVYQLFYNLINNALKFSNGKPVVSITAKVLPVSDIKLYPDLHPAVKYTVLSFKDNGIGFDQKYAQQIFTIFKRLNSKETFEGTGIGLSLCKKITDNHHGVISAESEPGKGTTFTVILPVE